MADESAMDLEDLARRYDAQVLREYLLEQEGAPRTAASLELDPEAQRLPWAEVLELRPRSFRLLRALLALNFVGFWSAVAYCGHACQLRVEEAGLEGFSPPLESSLLVVFVLSTQATLELAAAACLTQPARSLDARGVGFRAWDGAAWLAGAGSRAAVLLDVQCLPLMRRGSSLLFLLSMGAFAFSIGIFVFLVQLRILVGMFCARDQFSYDKPDLFFKGRDAFGVTDGAPIAAGPPAVARGREEDTPGHLRLDRSPPLNTIKVANCAHFSDLAMLHAVVTRLYVPMSARETQEFVMSATSFSRCFCEDIVQCSVKFFFLMDCEMNALVVVSLLVSALQAVSSCFYSSTPSMDLRQSEDGFLQD